MLLSIETPERKNLLLSVSRSPEWILEKYLSDTSDGKGLINVDNSFTP